MKSVRFFLFTIILFLVHQSSAQDLLDLIGRGAGAMAGKYGAKEMDRLDSIDFQFAISMNDNAGFFDIQQKGETKAEVAYGMGRSENEKSIKEKVRDTLEMGVGQYGIRRYRQAEKTFLNAKALTEQHGLKGDIIYLRTLSCLGLIYLVQGRTADSEKYISACLAMSEKNLGKKSAAYVANLNNQAKLHQTLGQYNEAEREFEEALRLSKELFGGAMQTAIIINNQAMLEQTLGRFDNALKLMNDAIAGTAGAPKKIIEGQSYDNRRFQANLATMLQLQGKYEEAEKIFLEVKKAADVRKQTNSQEYGSLLNQMGILYIQMGRNEKVEEMLLQSAVIFRKRFGDKNFLLAKVSNDLGNFYRLTGRNDEALKQLNNAYSIREAILKPNHPDFVQTQEDLALLHWKMGKMDTAFPYYKDVMEKTLNFIGQYFGPMSEAEKTKYWDITSQRFHRFYNFALASKEKQPDAIKVFYSSHLATKAILLGSTTRVRQIILNSNDKKLSSDYTEWLDLKESIIKAYGFSKKKLSDEKIDIDALERAANAMEKSLSARSTEFNSGYSINQVSINQLTQGLGDQEAIIDIVRVRGFDQKFNDDSKYVVFVLKKNDGVPQLIVLDKGRELEERTSKLYRNSIKKLIPESTSYDEFWAPIESKLQGIQKLYISPDGVYNQLNVNTLKGATGDFVLNRFDIVLLGNAKDILAQDKSVALKKTMIGFNPGVVIQGNAALVGFPSYGSDFEQLPGTKVELEGISKILAAKGIIVKSYMQKEATEKQMKLIKSPTLLHVATHGYFFPDTKEATGSTFGVNPENAADDPLFRSGLILGEAAHKMTTAQADLGSSDDGYLTAYEVMNLTLEGTGIVVLSACETGLGDVKSGEGVYGLQRAFSIAGAKAIVMSLWKVDDAATQELMTNFYTNWIKLGDLQKAFKQAQLQLMAKYKEPYYWGAFVMTGM